MRRIPHHALCVAAVVAWLAAPPAAPAAENWRDQGVVLVRKSPHARLRDIPVRAVAIKEGLWGTRRQVNVEVSIPAILPLIEEHGYIDNFRRLSKGKNVPKKGPVFADTDPYKWLEAVGFALQSEDRPALRELAGKVIDEIVAIQEPSGYLNAHFNGDLVPKRLIPETMEYGHELYNLGHMLQGAIAYYRATGDRKLLDAGARFADYLYRDFGPGKKPLLAGHPEVEMALIELYRTTGERRYLELAGYLLGGDERLQRRPDRVVYTFSGTPFVSRKQLEGHSVRAMYACSGAADYYLETGDQAYRQTLERLWQDLTRSKVYVTGGVGSRWTGEAFGEPYELPNARSYAETCAAIGSMMWNWRMLMATGDARYTDIIEQALYNAINVGVSVDGRLYCYRNPLEMSDVREPNWQSRDGNIRNAWYDVLCCPPNIQRTLASLPGYFYSTAGDGLYVHLFHNSELSWKLEDNTPIRVSQRTRYPWEGDIDMEVRPDKEVEFTVHVRIPGWAAKADVLVNGAFGAAPRPGSYLPIRRLWKPGDTVRVKLDMTPQLVTSNPRIRENVGRAAVRRGPLVYALEKIDQPPEVGNLFDVMLTLGKDPGAGFKPETRPDLLGGVVVLRHAAESYKNQLSNEPLYNILRGAEPRRATQSTELTFIPYYVVANREPTPMTVWVPYTRP